MQNGLGDAREFSLRYSRLFFNILFSYFVEGKGGKREGENINVWLPLVHPLLGTWPAAQACALTGNQTSGPLVCSPRSIQ